MASEVEQLQLCVACGKMNSLAINSCKCGHVLREGLALNKENLRRRRPPHRPNSVSSECIGKSQNRTFRQMAKANTNQSSSERVALKRKRDVKTKSKMRRTAFTDYENKLGMYDENKREQIKEVLDLIQHSYQNIYFHRCKSYRKVKINDFNFEFDFSTFESHAPYYPTALEDINRKIVRTTAFKLAVNKNIS